MCGRYTITAPLEAIRDVFEVAERPNLAPRYNVAPSQSVPIVRRPPRERRSGDGDSGSGDPGDGESARRRELVTVTWGLIPFWAKDATIANKLINARGESVADKPAFRDSFAKRRCLVVADGFYEWKKVEGGKQPYRIRLASGAPFGFAGLWSDWTSPEGERRETCTIVTTRANALVAPIHDRMPVILDPADFDAWLDGEREAATALIRPHDPSAMEAYPVDRRVGNVRNDDEGLVAPLAEQGSLF
ncbi:MAG: SOS response-associated peptidase [Azospirillaceae bacterium]